MNRRYLILLVGLALLVSANTGPVRAQGRYSVRAIAIDPNAPDTIYAGARYGSGGIFKSTDGGRSWREANTGLPPSRGVASLAIDPVTTQTVYAWVDQFLYKSENGGGSWARLGSLTSNFFATTSIVIDPYDPLTLYTSAYSGTSIALFKSTDQGATWQRKVWGATVAGAALDPTDTSILYLATLRSVIKSADGGDTWDLSEQNPSAGQISSLLIDLRSPNILYVGNAESYAYGRGVFKTLNRGVTWSFPMLRLEVTALGMSPEDSQTLYAGTLVNGVWKSEDGGQNWREVNTSLSNRSIIGLAIDPQRPSILYAGTDTGLFKSENGGGTWFFIGP